MEPLKFNALLKSTIWGGEKIIPFKHLDVQQENVGESWEISGVPGNETVVANGEYAGKKLNDLVHELKGKLSSSSTHVRTSLFRFIPPTRLQSVRARSVARQRCGICSRQTQTLLCFAV